MFGWFRRKKTPSPCMRQRLREWLRSVPKCKKCAMSPEAFSKLKGELDAMHRIGIGGDPSLVDSFLFNQVLVYPDSSVPIDFMAR